MNEKEAIERALFSDTSQYNDIMDKPRHVSQAHLPMLQSDRAAQFAPFAALTGYHKLLAETATRYRHKRYPSRTEKEQLVSTIKKLTTQLPVNLKVEYFNGQSGYYQEEEGQVQKINWACQRLVLADNAIPFANIRKLKVI